MTSRMMVRRLAALMMPTLGPVFSLVRKRRPATARDQMRMMRKRPTPTPRTLADSVSSIPQLPPVRTVWQVFTQPGFLMLVTNSDGVRGPAST